MSRLQIALYVVIIGLLATIMWRQHNHEQRIEEMFSHNSDEHLMMKTYGVPRNSQ